jgi:plastocyanin
LRAYDAHLTSSRTFGTIMRLGVALVVACSPSTTAAPSTSAPSAAATLAVQSATVESAVRPAGSILVEMTNYAFKPADIPLIRGKNVLYLVNPSNEVHSIQLRNPTVSVVAVVASSADVEAGHSAIFTIENLPAGTYRVTCPITNHAIQGMVGSATVP